MKQTLWCWIVLFTACAPPEVHERLTVDVSVDRGEATRRAGGILFGLSKDAPGDELVDPLKSGPFRTAKFYNDDRDPYARMSQRGKVIFALGIPQSYGCDGCDPLPGENGDFSKWEAQVESMVQDAITRGETYDWDIWNEPQYDVHWSDEPWPDARFLESWRVAHQKVRSLQPTASIEGPSPSIYDEKALKAFIDFASANDVMPDILTWHEFGPSFGLPGPDSLGSRVEAMRAYAAEKGHPALRIRINEFLGPDEHLRPGSAIWYFAHLERAQVDAAVRTCWNDNCFDNSLAGLLTPDGKRRSVWWAHRAYADVTGRLGEVTPSESFDGLAAISATERTVRLAIGNHARVSGTVTLEIRGAADATAATCFQLSGFHAADSGSGSQEEAEPLDAVQVQAVDGVIEVPLEASTGYDAWSVTLTPCDEM